VPLQAPPVPKYRQIYAHLREAIGSGRYSTGQRLPSEAQLVETFETSRITVNRALRELQTEGLIERRAGSGSYVRSRSVEGYQLGLLIPGLGQTEIFEPICRGMSQAEQAAHHVLLWGKSLAESDLDAAHVRDSCEQLIGKQVSGVFFAPLELTPERDAMNRFIVQQFDKARIPVVLLDRDLVQYPARSKYDVVGIDNRRAGHVITAHLMAAGAKRVAFVARPESAPTVETRALGYREALQEAGWEFDPQLVCRVDPTNLADIQALLKRTKADAIVCANDITAAQLMRTLQELGVSVPQKVRLTGIDDVKYASLLPVPLTTIHQPCADIGKMAIAAMVHRLQNPALPAQDVLLNFRLVVRQSCGTRVPHDDQRGA
jgi:GntR family transcriptional regulator of arabinose operon